MSVLQNPVRHQPFAAIARLARLRLLCRFDFQQKTWSLPTFDNPQDAEAALAIFARGFLPASFSSANNFSDPARGGITPIKLASGRVGIRSDRLLGKPDQTKPTKRKK